MRALSLTQPWATLVAIGAKRIETRGWSTKYRGPLAIHASKAFPPDALTLCFTTPFREVLAAAGILRPRDLPQGEIIARVTLADCVAFNAANRVWERGATFEKQFGDYTPGRFGFVLTDLARLVTTIPCRGALSLWAVPADIVHQLGEQDAYANN